MERVPLGRLPEGLVALCVVLGPLDGIRAEGSSGQPGSFLRQESSARSLALGGAGGLVFDGTPGLAANPAAVSGLVKPEVSASHVILFEDTQHDFFSAGVPLQRLGVLAVGYSRQASGSFEKRSGPLDAPTEFSIVQSALSLGWGLKAGWPAPMRFGVAVKSAQESIDTASDSDLGADVGLLVEPVAGLRLGAAWQNALAPEMRFVTEAQAYAKGLDLALAYEWEAARGWTLVPVARISRFGDGGWRPSGGVEVDLRRTAFLRAGMQDKGMAGGMGVRWGNSQLDYAVLFHDLGLAHQMTLTLRFGQTKEELEEVIRQGIQKFTRDEAGRLSKAYQRQAEIFLQENNYAKAVSALEAAALWDPSDPAVSRRHAEVLSQMDRLVGRQILERTILLAEQSFLRGSYVASQTYWESVLSLDPGNAKAQEYLVRIGKTLGKEQEEIQRAQRERAHLQALEMLRISRGLLEQGKYGDAIAQAERALRISPEDTVVKILLEQAKEKRAADLKRRFSEGARWVEAREYGKALALFDSILAEDPQNQEVAARIQQIQAEIKKPLPPEVQRKLDQQYYRAVDAYLNGRYPEAQGFLKEILEADPANENARKLKEKLEAALQIAR